MLITLRSIIHHIDLKLRTYNWVKEKLSMASGDATVSDLNNNRKIGVKLKQPQ